MLSRSRFLTWTAFALTAAVASVVPGSPAAAAPPPAPRLLTIKTVPPIPGVSVVLNGVGLTTGADGTVQTLVTAQQRSDLAADRDAHLVVSTQRVDLSPGVRARFHGWYDGGYHYSATDKSGQVEVAAFDVDYLTSFTFADTHGAVVDPARVTAVELRDASGTTTKAHGTTPIWLSGRSVVASSGRVSVRDDEHRFLRVMVDHVNVVRRGRLRFLPRYKSHVRVNLNLLTITFHAQDALFGLARGSAITLQLEDGTTHRYPLHDGKVTVTALPPGKYIVTAKAIGLGREQTFAFSKDGVGDIQIIDPLDAGLVLGVLGLIGILLVLQGRRMRRKRRAKRPPTGLEDGTDASVPYRAMSSVGADIQTGDR